MGVNQRPVLQRPLPLLGTLGLGDWTKFSPKSTITLHRGRSGSPWDCADAQLLRLRPGCIPLRCQHSWQDHYLCSKLLIKPLLAVRRYVVGGKAGWWSLSSLMRLCSPNLTANQIFMLCAFITGRERGGRWEAAQTQPPQFSSTSRSSAAEGIRFTSFKHLFVDDFCNQRGGG